VEDPLKSQWGDGVRSARHSSTDGPAEGNHAGGAHKAHRLRRARASSAPECARAQESSPSLTTALSSALRRPSLCPTPCVYSSSRTRQREELRGEVCCFRQREAHTQGTHPRHHTQGTHPSHTPKAHTQGAHPGTHPRHTPKAQPRAPGTGACQRCQAVTKELWKGATPLQGH